MSYLDDRADLKGRVAVIVGGGGGLGRACATDLAGAGMRLALCDRDGASLDETVALITEAGGEVMSGELDARDTDTLTAFFADVDARYGTRCDVLINVVGGTFRQPFEESNPRGWDALIRTNFTWLLHSTQLAVARMQDGGGSIINITSIEAHRAAPGYAGLRGHEGCRHQPHPDACRRTGAQRNSHQHHCPRLHRHARAGLVERRVCAKKWSPSSTASAPRWAGSASSKTPEVVRCFWHRICRRS